LFNIICHHIKRLFDYQKKSIDVTCTRILITSRIITAKALIQFLDSFSLILQIIKKVDTVKPVYNGHPWDPKKVAVIQSWPVVTGFSIKIGIKSSLAGLRLAVVDRWPLLRGGR
jgi:hypothetical protein